MRDEIERKAEEIAEKHGVVDDVGWTDVDQLVSALGGNVEISFETASNPESLHVRDDGDFTVVVPWNTSVARDRFTIAHELGHYLLHYSRSNGARSFNRYGRDRQEAEANAFAAALLMPAKHFLSAWDEMKGDLVRIADRFEVSYSAARVRAAVLGSL